MTTSLTQATINPVAQFGLLSDDEIDRCLRNDLSILESYDPSRLVDTGYLLGFEYEATLRKATGNVRINFYERHRVVIGPDEELILTSLETISLPRNLFAKIRSNDSHQLGFSTTSDIKIPSSFRGKVIIKIHNKTPHPKEVRYVDPLVELEFYEKKPSKLQRPPPRMDRIEISFYVVASESRSVNGSDPSSTSTIQRVGEFVGGLVKAWSGKR